MEKQTTFLSSRTETDGLPSSNYLGNDLARSVEEPRHYPKIESSGGHGFCTLCSCEFISLKKKNSLHCEAEKFLYADTVLSQHKLGVYRDVSLG